MKANIKQFFTPPTFANDRQKSHTASLLKTILLITIGLNLAVIPVLMLVLENPSLVGDSLLLAAQLALWFALRRGYLYQSSFLFCFALWAFVTYISYNFGAYNHLLPTGYIVLALVATILLPRTGRYGFYGLAVASVGVITYLELSGQLSPSLAPLSPAYMGVVLIFVLTAIVALLGLAVDKTNEALAQAQGELVERGKREAALRRSEANLAVDNDQDEIVYVEMVGPKGMVRSNWAALAGKKAHWLGSQRVYLNGMKNHICLDARRRRHRAALVAPLRPRPTARPDRRPGAGLQSAATGPERESLSFPLPIR
jgi:hypothetical protein